MVNHDVKKLKSLESSTAFYVTFSLASVKQFTNVGDTVDAKGFKAEMAHFAKEFSASLRKGKLKPVKVESNHSLSQQYVAFLKEEKNLKKELTILHQIDKKIEKVSSNYGKRLLKFKKSHVRKYGYPISTFGFEFAIDNVHTASSFHVKNSTIHSKSGDTFVFVRLTITNQSPKSQNGGISSTISLKNGISLLDSKKVSYSIDAQASLGPYFNVQSENILPGQSKTGEIVFEVPKSDTHFSFEISGSPSKINFSLH